MPSKPKSQSANITDNLKKYFYSGVGLASHTGEIVRKAVDEVVKQSKVNESDGKKIVQDAIKKIESRRPEWEKKYNEVMDKAMKFANAEIAMLQKKISSLEKKGGVKEVKRQVKTVAKKAARKVAAKPSAKAVKKVAAEKR